MKRRSPWLAFAACVLMRGSSVHAEPAEKLALNISKASAVAESELAKLGLALDHAVVSVVLIRATGQPAYYSARIEPPIPAKAVKDALLPKLELTEDSSVSFKIAMDGSVTLTNESPQHRRIRVSNSSLP